MYPQRWLMRFAAFALAWWVQTVVAQTEKAQAARAVKPEAIIESKNVEINFFGKVVDQNDQPLAAVAVQAEARGWYMKNPIEPEGKFHRPATMTGVDGTFSFTRLRGDAFGILSLAKDGYALSTKAKLNYSYGPLPHHYAPNPLQPVVFHMWKTNGAVKLFRVDISKSIPQDGTVVALDLRKNRLVSQPDDFADIRVVIQHRAPAGQRSTIPHFDWSIVLEAPEGGVMQTHDEFTYLAPEQGYLPRWSKEHLKDQADWKFMDEAELYLHNRAGEQYGRLAVSFKVNAGYPTGHLTVRGFLNPNGRVLEYDQRLTLRAEQSSQPSPRFGVPAPIPAANAQPANGTVIPPPSTFPPPGFPALPPQFTPPTNNPAFPQPPPGFQALTNRGRPFPPPAPPRPPQ